MKYETFFKIFDSKLQPILLYSSDIWGLQRLENIEKIHLMACKRFFGVPVRTPNKMVYGDLGRFPLLINSYISSIKYWFRLLEMGNDRLQKAAYEMLLCLDRNGKTSGFVELGKFCVKLDSILYGCSKGLVIKTHFEVIQTKASRYVYTGMVWSC